jgi:ribosomal protein L7/L12
MLNIIIQNDGKIKFQSECSNTKEMKFNVNLLLGVVQSMEIEEQANSKNPNTSNTNSYYLYLNKIDNNNKVETVRTVRDQLKIDLKEAKDIVLDVANGRKMMIMQSFDYSAITSVCESLEAKGCTCEITSN